MTVKEYIASLLTGLKVPEAFYADMDLNLDEEYVKGMAVGPAVVSAMEGLINSPMTTNVSENGFSMSWDRKNLGKYYLWLCKHFGIKPDNEILALCGIHALIDMTDSW